MSERRPPSAVETRSLSLSPAEQWTLHHALSDHLDAWGGEPGDEGSIGTVTADASTVRRAFETLDAGEHDDGYTRAQLVAMREVLAASHHDTAWETERPRLETLLHRVSVALE